MGNLGWYQLITTWSKKVGGPRTFLLLVAAGGYTIVRSVEAGGKKVYRLVKDKRKSGTPKSNLESFIFTENGIGENGLSFSKGDKFFIVAIHDDAILIEKENDDNNPYFVSAKWLQTLSNYEIGKKEV